MSRIVVYSHKLLRKTQNGFQTDGAYPLQIDSLANYYDQLILCVPVLDNEGFKGIGFRADNVCVHPLPPFQDKWDFLVNIPKLFREILSAMKGANLDLVLLPGYLGVLASYICQQKDFPIFQWVVGDWSRNVRIRRKGLSVIVGIAVSPLLNLMVSRLTRDVLTFFNGKILYGHHKSHHHIRISSSISSKDIFENAVIKNPIMPPFRLLYVGRLSIEKGITYLLRAVATAENPQHYRIDIVGEGPIRDSLTYQAKRLGIWNFVTFHGYLPWGKQLLNLYRQKHIFVLPALQDQQPKVLLEAMSQSLPIVATEVGGIPSIISNGVNGILVPPANPKALLNAIQRLLVLDERELMINNGLSFVRSRTIEHETSKMMQVVDNYFGYMG